MIMKTPFIRYHLPAVLWAVLIFVLSSLVVQVPPIEHLGEWTDEFYHVMEYFIFGFLLARSFTHSTVEGFRNNVFLISFFIGSLYGVTDEIHQFFVPGREAFWLDAVADSVGTFLGALIFCLLMRYRVK